MSINFNMGNSSSTLQKDNSKDFIWDPIRERNCISYNEYNNPKFYTEELLSFFTIVNQEESFFPFSKPKNHKTEDLAQLILGYYEELNNIPQILETIIEGDIEQEDDIIKYLCYCFYSCIQTAENSCALHSFNFEFSRKFFSPFFLSSFSPIQGFDQPSFSILLTSLSTSFSLLEDPKFPSQSILPFLDFMNNSITTVTVTPPSPEFLPEGSNPLKDLTFTAGYVNPHGICTNGKFLFILCSNNALQIIPLLNGSSMSSLITVYLNNVPVQIPQEANINADEKKVQITFTENNVHNLLTFDIQSLIQNNLPPQNRPTPTNLFRGECSCSDGIIQVLIQNDHTFAVFNSSDKRQILISRFDESKSKLPSDLSTVVVETNGNFISFIIQDQNDRNNNSNNFAFYKTYSIHGYFLREEKFPMNEQIIASCIDSINKCHWSVISAGNSRFILRRYAFCGGENSAIFDIDKYSYPTSPNPSPFAFFSMIISGLHRHLRGMINSHISPNVFLVQRAEEFFKLIEIIEKVINYPEDKIHLIKECQKAAKECLTILISLNLKRISCTSEPSELITTRILKLLKLLPLNLASLLFFSNFDYLIFNQVDDAILLLIGLLKSMTNHYLIFFALRMIEDSKNLAMINFKRSNGLFDMIPQDCRPISSFGNNIFIFLLLHQRCLVREARLFLKEDPLAVINFSNYQTYESKTVLDLLGDYMQNLFSIFENVLSIHQANEIVNSAIYVLFCNFLRLLSSLAEFHSIAQVATATLSMVINQLTKLMEIAPKTVLNVVFIFGKFASTLLKGGIMSDLETKFLWLIRANVNLIDDPDLISNLDSEEIENFKDERINFFLNSEGNSIDEIYKKIKPLLNRNLNYKIREIDRLALVAFSKHLDCLEEMLFFDGTRQPSAKLRSAFEQMLLVRNEFRRCLQNNKDTSVLRTKCLMLLRMENDQQLHPKSLGDFVVMKIEPSYFKKIIIGQRKRIETTLVGFALLDQSYIQNVDPLVHRIIGYNLAMIESFEGLYSIMRISKLKESQEKQILTFFQRVIEAATKEKSMLLIIVAYRFFRDLDSLKVVQNSVLISVLSAYNSMPQSYSLFALALSLIKGITEIPSQLLNSDNIGNLYRWLLLSESTKYVKPPEDFVSNLIQKFWSYKPEEMRLVLRVLYNIQDMISDPHTIFGAFLQFIGVQIKAFRNIPISSEIIYFLRQILANDNAPLKKSLTMYILSANLQNTNESFILGIFCVLGLKIEEIRPYATVNYHPSRNEIYQYYAIPSNKKLMFYPKPFHLQSDSIVSIPLQQSDIYAVPMIEIEPDQFPYFDFILSFYIPLTQLFCTTTVTYAIYMQTFASFCRNATFVSKISSDSLLKLYENPISFHNIKDTIRSINSITHLGVNQEISGFNVLSFNGIEYKSMISPVLLENVSSFEVTIMLPSTCPKCGYFGIISDNLEPFYTRYSLVSYPEGEFYPNTREVSPVKFNESLPFFKVTIYMPKRQFWIENRIFNFPIGSQFRIIFATKLPNINEVKVTINPEIGIFNMNSTPPIQSFDYSDSYELYSIPKWSYDYSKELPSDISKLPSLSKIISPYSDKEKNRYIFTPPPSNIIIHGGYSHAASPMILQSLYSGMFLKLALQYTTVALMRIVNINVGFAKPVLFRLFRFFILTIESFSTTLCQSGYFPFEMAEPIWKRDVDPIYFSLENEVKKALLGIVSDADNIKSIATEIWKLSNSRKLHSMMLPQPSLFYYPQAPPSINVHRDEIKILFNNDFDFASETDAVIQGHKVRFPLIYTKKPVATLVNITNRKRPLGVLTVNPMNNDWLANTPLELFLLLKNFVFIAPQEHRPMIKSIILDCFLIRSPIAACYLNNFADFVQMQIPSTPLDQNPEYLARLALVGSCLKVVKDPNFINIYQKEQRLMSNKMAADLACHFPEFFSSPLPPPKSKNCQIPAVIINPGALDVDFTNHILTLRLFNKSYESLAGFPFWEILPYWIKISGLQTENINTENINNQRPNQRPNENGYEFVAPKVSRVNNEIVKVSNPSIPNLRVLLKKNPNVTQRASADSLLMYSTSSQFDDAEYVQFGHFLDPIYISTGETYFSLSLFMASPTFSSPWDVYYLYLDYDGHIENMTSVGSQSQQIHEIISRLRQNRLLPRSKSKQKSSFDYNNITVIDPEKIRSQFVNDMKQFAIDWKENDTNDLLNQIPQIAFANDIFDDIEHIARTSSLSSVFSPTVVVLRALILHHFNYIYSIHHNEVPEDIWQHFSSFMSIDVASKSLLQTIATTHFARGQGPIFEINRRRARAMIANGKGDPRFSIISQLSTFIFKFGASQFRAREKPWTVTFKGESGIDVGGPARELLVEASTSIFETTSQLMVQVDASTKGESRFYYVPNEKALDKSKEFYTIGVLIGIIIRTGLLQDLPFAPIVWKAIAGEAITDDDVFESDRLFRESFREINNNFKSLTRLNSTNQLKSEANSNEVSNININKTWTVECWNGNKVGLPGRNSQALVEPSQLIQYQRDCLTFRKRSIKKMLDSMRNGFVDNTDVRNHYLMKGSLLSRLAQGSGKITIEQMKAITDVNGFPEGKNNTYIKRFWNAVSRFNDDEMKLLFKFITTLTRMPSAARMDKEFKITIDQMNCANPDIMMPTASTCFNKLHLPLYSSDEIAYQKILYAIRFCTTMENK